MSVFSKYVFSECVYVFVCVFAGCVFVFCVYVFAEDFVCLLSVYLQLCTYVCV